MVLNPYVVLSPDWLAKAVEFMDSHPKYGAIGGKTKRYQYSNDDLKEVQESGIIDSTGFLMRRSRYCTDRGAGEQDTGQFDQAEDIFGISGSCLFLRRAGLVEIRYGEESLDADVFA